MELDAWVAEDRQAAERRRQHTAREARHEILRQSTDLDEGAASALLLKLAELDRHDAQQRMEDELPRQEAALQAREMLLLKVDAGICLPEDSASYT